MFINLKNRENEKLTQIKVGYSWSTLFLGPLPSLINKVWPWFLIILFTDIILFYPTIIVGTIIANAIFAAYVNKKHVIYLLNKGWHPADKKSKNIIKNSYLLPIEKNINIHSDKETLKSNISVKQTKKEENVTAIPIENKTKTVKSNPNSPKKSLKEIKTNNYDYNHVEKDIINNNKETQNINDDQKKDNKIKRTPSKITVHHRWKPYYNYMVLDIETTGLNSVNNDIIQISAIRYIDDKPVKTFNHYVKTQNDEISPKIYSLTGISNDDIKDGLSLNDALTELEKFYNSNMKPAIIGHNISFDINFLSQKGLNVSEITTEDTLLMSKQVKNELNLPDNKLETLKNYYGIKNRSHNSLNDVKTTAIVYQKLRDAGYKSKNSRTKGNSNPSPNKFGLYMQSKVTNSSEKGKKILNKSIDNHGKLDGMSFAITGNLFELNRNDAKKAIENEGGIVKSGMSSKVNYLVVGVEDKKVVGEDGKSTKIRKAEELIKRGLSVEMLNEKQFIELLNK